MLEVAALQHDALGSGGTNNKVVGSVGEGCGGGHGEGRLAAGEGDTVPSGCCQHARQRARPTRSTGVLEPPGRHPV